MPISTVAVCCDDLGLMADARRLCAAAGLDAEVAGTLDAHRWWPSAVAVLLDATAAAQLAGEGLPRRPRVALLARDDDPVAWRLAVVLGAEQVTALPMEEPALLRGVLSARASKAGAPVVACVPASGGAGASTVAAGLATAAARQGTETVLVDGDVAGGGLDLLLGAEHAPGLRWPEVAALAADTPADVILDRLVRPAPRLRLLSWDRRHESHDTAVTGWPLTDLARFGVGLTVLDLPRSNPAPPTADVVLIVARAGVRQAVAAAALAGRLRAAVDDVRLVVRGAGRGGLTGAEAAPAVGPPPPVDLPEARRVPAAADDGQLARCLARLPFGSLAAALVAPPGR